MNELGFQANSAQMMSQKKYLCRKGRSSDKVFNSIFKQLFPLMKS